MQVSAADPQSAAERAGQSSAFNALGSEEFVKIIFAELANQDPLAPSDSKALLEQLSSIRSIQSDTDLSSRLSALVGQNELAAASGLIGRTVSGLDEYSQRIQGIVASVSRTGAGAVLTLKSGERLAMPNVDTVLEQAAPATPGNAS